MTTLLALALTAALTAGACVAAPVATAATAAPAAKPPLLSSSSPKASSSASPVFDEQRALRAAAADLFPAPTSSSYEVSSGDVTELYNEGLEYRNYTVRMNGAEVGRFTRVLVTGGSPKDTVDVAFRLSGASVSGATPVRPLVLGGTAVPAIWPAFAPFKALRAEDYGSQMATVFNALSFLARAGAPGAGPPPRPTGAIVNTMTVTTPKPVLGEPCPEFSAMAMDGRRMSPWAFKDKPFLVFIGSVRDGMSNEMMGLVHDFSDSLGDKAGLLEIFNDRAQHLLERMRAAGGQFFRGATVADPDATNQAVFKVPFIPYLLGYDAKHLLTFAVPYEGRNKLLAAVQEYRDVVIEGKPAKPKATPGPGATPKATAAPKASPVPAPSPRKPGTTGKGATPPK